MKCATCKNGSTQSSFSTIVLERDTMTLVFKRVPSQVCDNCGEEYISSDEAIFISCVRSPSDIAFAAAAIEIIGKDMARER